MAVTHNLGRVQGGGFYGSTSTSETSIPKSSVSAGSVAPLPGDVIVNANGDLCRITAVTSTAYTVSKFGSIKGATGAQGIQGETGPQGPKGDTGETGIYVGTAQANKVTFTVSGTTLTITTE